MNSTFLGQAVPGIGNGTNERQDRGHLWMHARNDVRLALKFRLEAAMLSRIEAERKRLQSTYISYVNQLGRNRLRLKLSLLSSFNFELKLKVSRLRPKSSHNWFN